MLAFPQSHSFIAKYGRDVHSYIVGTETEKKKRKEKKDIEPAAKKKIHHSAGGGGRGINVHTSISFRVAGFWPAARFNFGGVGDSLLTAADRYAYSVSVPHMYNIVGRERVEALCSEKWQEAWEARR